VHNVASQHDPSLSLSNYSDAEAAELWAAGEYLLSKLPPRQPGSMHKSLWDILGTLSTRNIDQDHPLNCPNTGGRGSFEPPTAGVLL